jgi:hypothetical protein
MCSPRMVGLAIGPPSSARSPEPVGGYRYSVVADPQQTVELLATSAPLRDVSQSSTVVPTVLWMNASGKRAASW